ncbi:MAG: UDP-N-acetylmuramate--L-alanine ligase [Bacilli bacterium]|nr:UDP-N-acetylmuramate--L-alanine ligase [Bacilli bacterium]
MKYYLIGIKGAGMSSLALFLDDLGYEVIGYDDAKEHRFTEDSLKERNIEIYTDPNQFELTNDIVVVRSPAIRDNHPELQRVFNLGLKNYQYQEMLGKLSTKFDTIGVAGCHGKTTTSSMLGHIFSNISGCNYIIGDGHGHADKESKRLVLESCEYRRHFLNYDIKYAIITNIEMDHTDYYKNMQDMLDAYQSFANNASKMVIACGSDSYTRYLEVDKPIFYYGIDDDNDIVAKDVEYRSDGTSFDVFIEDNYYGHFDVPLFGKHMLLNALAAIAICYYERLDAKEVAKHLKTFKGASRRFKETIIGNNVIVDDYAHHPTEVKVTIKAAKQKYPDKKIIAVFKPHTYSRVKEFQDDFADSLKIADYAYVMDINHDRELPEEYPGITPYTIIDKLKNADYINEEQVDKLLKYDNSVILFMSSKEIYILEELYIKRLKEKLNIV